MVHDVVEHDANGIVWIYKDTGNEAIMKDDGTVVIASTSAFSLDVKNVLINDLVRTKDLVKSAGGSTSEAPLVYYVDDPYTYRVLTYDFASPFALRFFFPECKLEKAMLTVTGPDYATRNNWNGQITSLGQHYFIDDKEVSGCDGASCNSNGLVPRGVSCVPGPCVQYTESSIVSVNPVDITGKIAAGIHKFSASDIDSRHTMIIEAVTSPSKNEMLLYSDDYKTMINETRSLPMTELYALIQPNTEAINTTITTLMTNVTEPAPACDWTGTWTEGGQIDTPSTMTLLQSGDGVDGSYTHNNGEIHGKISGKILNGTWSEGSVAGTFIFMIADDCNSFIGTWSRDGGASGTWTGTRVEPI